MENYSVLMSVYHAVRPSDLTESINSIFDQNVKTDDFVIVRDGPVSEDLDRILHQAKKNHPEVRLVILPENKGSGAARQAGLACVKHELVAIQDADDISVKDRCEKQLKFFEEHPDTDVLSGTVMEFSNNVYEITSKRELPTDAEAVREFAKKRNPVNQPCVMFKKSVIEKAGGYQEFYLLEDYYLWVRVLLAGGIIRNLPDSLLYMRAGSEMYKRRGGKAYAESQKKLFAYMLDKGFITKDQYRKSVLIRTASSLAPNGLRKAMFKKFNRKEADKP